MKTNKDNIVKKSNRIRNNHEIKKKKAVNKINCIIDTDPGVDDTAAIVLSLVDDIMDIRLITTVCGNLDIDTVTRNALHVLEKFNRTDIPVAKGASKAMYRVSPDATFIHQKDGMGGYIPPETVSTKPIEQDAVEAMYETVKKYANNICLIALGPHTNLGTLISRHPDVVDMISHIYAEGYSPYGWKSEGKWTNYISFNASSDPEALKIVVESGIPVTMVPSRMGRELANFTEDEVYKIRDINDVGRFIAEMYCGYWEHNYPDRRIATNDTCACLIMRFPELFKTKRARFVVDTDEAPGKTTIKYDKKGNVDFVYKVNKKKFHKLYFNAVEKMGQYKFYN
ncbi:MAG: nucleoside hydrolase [Clostridia bacterium]|nr:nucleoside hydrolase [Clostridia bacterium]